MRAGTRLARQGSTTCATPIRERRGLLRALELQQVEHRCRLAHGVPQHPDGKHLAVFNTVVPRCPRYRARTFHRRCAQTPSERYPTAWHHLVPAEWVTTQALSDVICLSESLFPFEPSSRQLESVLSATLKFYPHICLLYT